MSPPLPTRNHPLFLVPYPPFLVRWKGEVHAVPTHVSVLSNFPNKNFPCTTPGTESSMKFETETGRLGSYRGLLDGVSCANTRSFGRNSAFLRRDRSKTKRAWSGRGKGWFWHGGGCLGECFLPTRDPHSPSCGHFHTHFHKTQISRNAGMR